MEGFVKFDEVQFELQ